MNVRVLKSILKSLSKKVVSVLLLSVALISGMNETTAAVSVTAPSLSISTAAFPSVYYPLGNIVIDEGATGDFPITARNTDYTFTITAPGNFQFQAGTGTVTAIAGDITTVSVAVTTTTITVTYRSSQTNGNRQDQDDIITISGIQVRAITGTATQTATKTAGDETINGFGNGTVVANLTSTLATGCTHTLTITDNYGDGWNGGMVTVTVNGSPVLTNVTLATGSGPEDYTFTAANGDVINVTRTADGSFPDEMLVAITGGSSNNILATQQPVDLPGTSVLGCCAPTVPNLASYTSPANGTTDQNICGVTMTWVAPTSNGCNIATSYDVYFGTAASPPFVTNTTATSYTTSFLIPSTTYNWKIVPKNAVGDALGALTWSFTTSATVPTPGLATYNSPADAATGQNCCGVALSWTEPAITGCNGATSYDVYFGTSATPPLVTNITGTTYNTGALSTSTTYYWKIVSRNSFGTATGATTRSFTTGATICSSCTHSIQLTDTYGDGWDGGSAVTVKVNGTPVLTNITLGSGYGPAVFAFSASDGDVINVELTINGSSPGETRIEVLGAGSTVILPIQQPLAAPGTTISGCCTPVTPSCASAPAPANGATNINPCSVDFSWTAPASSGCNRATSYDFYLGTSPSPAFYTTVTGTSFALPNALADNTTYYWKIVPKNSVGSATGCSAWSFTTGNSSNPFYCLYGNAIDYPSAGSNCAQLTSSMSTQNGCAWNRGTISFASPFDYSVQMYFGAASGGADGCAFVFQNSPNGISQCGNNGGQLGAGGIDNAVVVEFDTYDNDNPSHVFDIAADHTAIEIDGDMMDGAPLCGPVQADPLDGLLADDLMHTLRVTWDPATNTLCVYVDGSQRISCVYDYVNNVFGGNPNVWWGFTGSTGLLANQQYFCPINIPLPVELMQFTASCTDEKPLLTWYTASETNNHYFVVERSEDGYQFDSIARVNGSGNTNNVIMYQFLDYTSTGTDLYYRLRQVDLNGENTELGIITTQCNSKNKLEIITVANHEGSALTLDFTTSVAGTHQIILHDINGKIIEQISVDCESGFNQADFCTRPEPGIYFFQIANPMESISYKCKL